MNTLPLFQRPLTNWDRATYWGGYVHKDHKASHLEYDVAIIAQSADRYEQPFAVWLRRWNRRRYSATSRRGFKARFFECPSLDVAEQVAEQIIKTLNQRERSRGAA